MDKRKPTFKTLYNLLCKDNFERFKELYDQTIDNELFYKEEIIVTDDSYYDYDLLLDSEAQDDELYNAYLWIEKMMFKSIHMGQTRFSSFIHEKYTNHRLLYPYVGGFFRSEDTVIRFMETAIKQNREDMLLFIFKATEKLTFFIKHDRTFHHIDRPLLFFYNKGILHRIVIAVFHKIQKEWRVHQFLRRKLIYRPDSYYIRRLANTFD